MPLYEFKCEECGNTFSEIKKLGDFSAECPNCTSDKTHKLMSSFSSKSASTSSVPSFSGGGGCAQGGGG